jgi:hypothetical protein
MLVRRRLASRSFALILRKRWARLPSVIRPSALAASSADVFARLLPSSSASPSATDLRGSNLGRRADGVGVAIAELGRPTEDLEGVLPLARLERGRKCVSDSAFAKLDPGLFRSLDTLDLPDIADCGRAVASLDGAAPVGFTLTAGQNMPSP